MIESLHSPHIGRVKALIGSKGAKERREQGLFVAEGVQCAREALAAAEGPELKLLYATETGLSKISELDLNSIEIVEVSEAVMKAMSDTVSPQGLISLCYKPEREIAELKATGSSRFIYLHEIQDPGNAGTILRTAEAMGISAVITSPDSVFTKGCPLYRRFTMECPRIRRHLLRSRCCSISERSEVASLIPCKNFDY
jgi:TrmH family RNA methyltransferase